MRSIKTRIILLICATITISLAIVGSAVVYSMYTNSMNILKQTMTETAKTSANYVQESILTYKTLLNEISMLTRLTSKDYTYEQRGQILQDKNDYYGFYMSAYTTLDGTTYPQGINIADRDYFQAAKRGETFVTEPFFSDSLNKMVIAMTAPVKKDNAVDGVVCMILDANFLSDVSKQINVGKTSNAFILDKNGVTIAHDNPQNVLDRNNVIEMAKSDKSLASSAEAQKQMITGVTGFSSYSYNKVDKFIAYAPIPGSNGWSLAVNADKSEFMSETYNTIYFLVVIILLSLIAGVVVSFYLARSIIKPIKEVESAAKSIAKGHLDVNVAYKSSDELGSLADNIREMSATIKTYIWDISRAMNEMVKGNFMIKPSQPFIGDFENIEKAITKFIFTFSDTVYDLRDTSMNVSTNSTQVSSGAHSLAQGVTEQASTIQDLFSTISKISSQVINNAQNAGKANNMAIDASSALNQSNAEMQHLLEAMTDINAKSNEINKIIRTIQDIAFQTNILALNASVEAARAGAAGKSFSVVADEVRNLSQKTAAAATDTTRLIGDSVKSISEGVKIAESTAKELNVAVDSVNATTALIEEISLASNEQAASIEQLSSGIDQISAVVQTNSATSEESAAASEKLSEQAHVLKDLISRFTPIDFSTIPNEVVVQVLGKNPSIRKIENEPITHRAKRINLEPKIDSLSNYHSEGMGKY